jgi:hypothetical protein
VHHLAAAAGAGLADDLSSTSGARAPSDTINATKFETFLAYIRLAWCGAWEGTSRGPMTRTPPTSTVSPALVASQLPPCSAARSTTTDPGAMPRTISSVTSTGAVDPCTCAVVMTTSDRATTLAICSRCRASCSSVILLA